MNDKNRLNSAVSVKCNVM